MHPTLSQGLGADNRGGGLAPAPYSWEHRLKHLEAVLIAAVGMVVYPSAAIAQTAGPAAWQNDLKPIAATDWNYDFAAHLLERAGFAPFALKDDGSLEALDVIALIGAEEQRDLIWIRRKAAGK